jgi:hypothetical protein
MKKGGQKRKHLVCWEVLEKKQMREDENEERRKEGKRGARL